MSTSLPESESVDRSPAPVTTPTATVTEVYDADDDESIFEEDFASLTIASSSSSSSSGNDGDASGAHYSDQPELGSPKMSALRIAAHDGSSEEPRAGVHPAAAAADSPISSAMQGLQLEGPYADAVLECKNILLQHQKAWTRQTISSTTLLLQSTLQTLHAALLPTQVGPDAQDQHFEAASKCAKILARVAQRLQKLANDHTHTLLIAIIRADVKNLLVNAAPLLGGEETNDVPKMELAEIREGPEEARRGKRKMPRREEEEEEEEEKKKKEAIMGVNSGSSRCEADAKSVEMRDVGGEGAEVEEVAKGTPAAEERKDSKSTLL